MCQTDGKLLADRALSRLLKGEWPQTLEELEEKKAAVKAMVSKVELPKTKDAGRKKK
ncbi:hypothetical protein QQ056_00220 [Oscillatoria laete-virens NRMC-F 0139]|nr:hypothetical protein [Oscillatoria laete-virens]MDL5052004.1 hypothetical protein [Oscillatoria laete-virens NRMC-F 0139]